MVIHVRKSKDDIWGFPESFNTYFYGSKGYVKVTAVVTPEGKLSEPYVFRGEKFIPAKEIDKEMGVEKYIKAKKPFYCLLNDGFIVSIKAGVDCTTGEYLPEKTSYSIYNISKTSGSSINSGEIQLVGILELPQQIRDLMEKLARDVASCRGNRIQYLKSRFSEDDSSKNEDSMEEDMTVSAEDE